MESASGCQALQCLSRPKSVHSGTSPVKTRKHKAWAEQRFLHTTQNWDINNDGPLDPFSIAEPEVDSVSERLRRSLLTDIPALGRAAEYFFQVRTPPCLEYLSVWRKSNHLLV